MTDKKIPTFRVAEDGNLEMQRPDGSWVKFKPGKNGEMNVETSDGRRVTMDGEGGMEVSFGEITSIGIANILELKSYSISREGNRVMHHGIFTDGRDFEVTMRVTSTTTAVLEVFRVAGGTVVQAGKDGAVVIGGTMPPEITAGDVA